ncbi:hypothetical protein BDV26DRAFT_289781 [Aspergillus bertholletiae]|uniref:Uncharacterized protein n=1 Tax=Aspergillus bertholletiae TaxID=1226010 RepID=A0A5N7BH34_9EURO|nr:hypothetical protein BDV26DRAFT_289781 [Aspergillus bertholletiae]
MASSQPTTTPDEGEFLTQQDGRFIIECLRHLDESKAVNLTNVRAALGYTNTASVANRFRTLRKRYGFPNLEATAKPSNMGATPAAAAPTTPLGQDKRKGPGVVTKKSMTKTFKSEDSFTTDESDAESIIAAEVFKVKATPKKGVRKGAKVTSTPTPAARKKHSKAEATSKAKAKEEPVKNECIDPNLLNAVNNAMGMYEERKDSEQE